jgi:RHS repeat-associated protein
MPGGRLAISSFQGSLRRREDVDGTLGSASLETDYFLHDSEQMIARYAKVGTGAVALKNRYLWGPQIDQLLTDEQISSGTSGTVYSVLGDHLQTVRELVTFNSASQTTSIVDHRQFDSFGNVVSDSNSSVDTFFKYTGKYFDVDTKLQWNLNRWYDPFLGQWVSEDPIGFAGGDENLRRYVSNSPLNRVDSNGLMDLWFYWYFYGLGGELNLNSPGYTTLLQRLTSSPVTASGISALKAKIARQVVSRVYSEAVAPDSSGSFTFDAKHNVDYTPGIWNTVIGGFQEVLGDHVVVGEPTDEYLERTTLYSLGGSKLIATVRVKWWWLSRRRQSFYH